MAETINCPACMSLNDASRDTCDYCDTDLYTEAAAIACPECMSQNDASRETCDYCEADLHAPGDEEDDHFSDGYAFATEPSEPGFTDELAADGGMPLDEVYKTDFAPLSDETAEESIAEDESAIPPELAAILSPPRKAHVPIDPLPKPGPYDQPASLRIFYNGEALGALAVDSACTTLGLNPEGQTDEDSIEYELEPVENDFPFDKAMIAEDEPAFELEELSEPALAADSDADAHGFETNSQDFEIGAPPSEPLSFEDPASLEEGAVIDLGQYGAAAKFARRHGYIFRQNKNYILYVLSDMGTQLNDEMLTLGSHRRLAHGDVIIVGGEVALQFRAPAA